MVYIKLYVWMIGKYVAYPSALSVIQYHIKALYWPITGFTFIYF